MWSHRAVPSAHRPPALRRQLRRAAALAAAHRATRSRSSATSPTSTTRSSTRRSSRAGRSGPSRTRTRWSSTPTYRALNVLPPTYEPLATGHIPEMHELIAELIAAGHAYSAADGSGDVYFDVAVVSGVRRALRPEPRRHAPPTDGGEPDKRDYRDFALWKGVKPDEPADAVLAVAVGAGPPGLAHRVLGDGPALPRRRVRHPRRRARPDLPAPRERDRPVQGRPGCRSPATGCTTPCSISARPR